MSGNFTISDLKRQLGPGLGLRKNKYLMEIPIPTADGGFQLNVLVRSTSLPERNIGTVSVWNKGRKFQVRGETEFPGTYEISIVDDSDMSIRKMFDAWLDTVDNTEIGTAQNKTFGLNVSGAGMTAKIWYQTEINVWQLDNNGNKVYGYKLQDAFPSSVGTVALDDDDENTLSEFSVTIAYSEFIPIQAEATASQPSSVTSGSFELGNLPRLPISGGLFNLD